MDTFFCNCSHLPVFVLSGAGPHPKALSGRVVSAVWWLFAVMLLACYFGNFSSMFHSNNKHVSIKTFEDLANQDVIDYGTVESGSTMLFFKVPEVAPNCCLTVHCPCLQNGKFLLLTLLSAASPHLRYLLAKYLTCKLLWIND